MMVGDCIQVEILDHVILQELCVSVHEQVRNTKNECGQLGCLLRESEV